VANRYIDAYLEDVEALGVKKATHNPRVTNVMDEIIDFISQLIEKDFAYELHGDVYFKPRAFDGYGKLSHQSLDELRSGARIQVDLEKQDPLDFALWKHAKDSEIAWDSPWGKGRPGWHIECSAMSKKYIGETIDIHAGGQDLAFPHHENEIAQSEALSGKTFANYWMHNGYININNEKMSKSLGNFVLARDLIHHYRPEVIRFFMLSVHYRNPINFSEELLEAADNSLSRIETTVRNLGHCKSTSADFGAKEAEWLETISQYIKQFETAMDDDFNTANAISILFDLAEEANTYLQEKQTSVQVITSIEEALSTILEVLGVEIQTETELLDEDIQQMIDERDEARKNRDFARADEIRDKLTEMNIILEDTAQGVRWKRG